MSKKGLTLLELLITTVMIGIMTGVVVYAFRAILISWGSMDNRTEVSINLDMGVQKIVNELREAKEISIVNNDEIRFSLDSTNYYIYYLYNSDDSYPPDFEEENYELKRANLSGGISGTFTYGDGRIFVRGVKPPPETDLSYTGGVITINITSSEQDEEIRNRTEIVPRNI